MKKAKMEGKVVSARTTPRKYSLVKFDFTKVPVKFQKKYPFKKNEIFVFMSEIANMPGHCVVLRHTTGKIYSGYHSDSFVELSPDEI